MARRGDNRRQSLFDEGYLNKPDETAHALREWHGKTWIHTGDIGVMDEEGYVYLKDRAKDMIIVSGFKCFQWRWKISCLRSSSSLIAR